MRRLAIARDKLGKKGNTKSVHFLRLRDCSVEQPGKHITWCESTCIVIYSSSTSNE